MVKKDSSKPRGKMSAYAFFLQTYRDELKQKDPNGSVNFAEFSKSCAEKWKGMDERTKKRYNDMAAGDKRRHQAEMANYVPAPGEGKRKRGKKDPNAPKRSLSAFFFFCAEERPRVKAALNNTNSVAEIAKELGHRWALVKPEQKTRYAALAAKDKERYEKEQKIYKAGGPGRSGLPNAKAALPVHQDEDDDDEEEEEDEE